MRGRVKASVSKQSETCGASWAGWRPHLQLAEQFDS